MAKDLEQTNIAFVSSSFARAFNNQFFDQRVSGYVAWMNEPEEQSTGGGARARQPMVLRAPDARPVIAIGWCNVATKECSLRSYAAVLDHHQRRFPGRAIDIDRAAYSALLVALRPFFEQRGMRLIMEEPAEAMPVAAAGAGSSAAGRPAPPQSALGVVSAGAKKIAVAEQSWLRENLGLVLFVVAVVFAAALVIAYLNLRS